MNTVSGRKNWILGLVLSGACATPATAATVTYADNRAGFIAATGAVSIGALPSSGASGTKVGDVTFTNGVVPGVSTAINFFNSSNEIPGNDLGASGVENFNMAISGGAYAIGFYVHEPAYFGINSGTTGTWGCNATCYDTTFSIELFAGATSLGKFNYNAPNDPTVDVGGPLGFFGVYSSMPFDSVRVRDVTNTNDNELFGSFLMSKSPAVVPLPATGWLLLSGLTALGVGTRRRRC